MKNEDFDIYLTEDLRLAALVLVKIPGTTSNILPSPNSFRKTVKLIFPLKNKDEVSRIAEDYRVRKAEVNLREWLDKYNLLRNSLEESLRGWKAW